LGYANGTFSTLHHKFLKEIWGDNVTTAKLHSNQVATDWENGRYECYIPTRDSVDRHLSYYRIAIQVLPMVSNEAKKEEAAKLSKPLLQPMGFVESELLVLIAPRQYRWGLVRAFKHQNKPGYFTAVFVNASPEVVWKRVLDHVNNFIGKRLDGLMASLGFETWVWKYLLKGTDNMLYYSRILERFSYSIRQSFFTFLNLHRHFRGAMQTILKVIGLENVALAAVRPLESLNQADLASVFKVIREKLSVSLNTTDEGLILLNRLGHRPC
jgi:hypothetical protein